MEEENELKVEDLWLNFGRIQALAGVTFSIDKIELLGIIGPNGAGKTCILNCISGFYRPQKGRVFWRGRDITHLASHKIAPLGIGRTFQTLTLYTGLNVLDNLMAARHIKMKKNLLTGALYFKWARDEEIRHRRYVEEIIDFLEIEHLRYRVLGTLPYGMRKRVDLGRALALEPKILLLDEPMAGMSFEEREDMARFIIDIIEAWKIPIIIVEHDMGVITDICDRTIVLDLGRQIAHGTPIEVMNNPKVVEAYIGKKE